MEEYRKTEHGGEGESETDNGGKNRDRKDANVVLCFGCVSNWWVVSNLGTMDGVRKGVVGVEEGVVGVVTEEWKRGEEDRGNNWSWGVQSVGKSSGERILKTKKEEREKGKEKGEREKEKGSKKQGQYTQRNVVLQTVELAKLKCTVTMGTLGEKEEKKD